MVEPRNHTLVFDFKHPLMSCFMVQGRPTTRDEAEKEALGLLAEAQSKCKLDRPVATQFAFEKQLAYLNDNAKNLKACVLCVLGFILSARYTVAQRKELVAALYDKYVATRGPLDIQRARKASEDAYNATSDRFKTSQRLFEVNKRFKGLRGPIDAAEKAFAEARGQHERDRRLRDEAIRASIADPATDPAEKLKRVTAALSDFQHTESAFGRAQADWDLQRTDFAAAAMQLQDTRDLDRRVEEEERLCIRNVRLANPTIWYTDPHIIFHSSDRMADAKRQRMSPEDKAMLRGPGPH